MKIFLIGCFTSKNLDDYAIYFSEIEFLKEIFKTEKIESFLASDCLCNLEYLKKILKKDDLIVLHGGGNVDNIFLEEIIISNFFDNKIVIFPQSVYFEEKDQSYSSNLLLNENVKKYKILENFVLEKKYRDQIKKIYSKHNNLHIFLRDKYSYRDIKNILPNANIYLVPDIVLLHKYEINDQYRENVLCFLRNDSLNRLIDKDLSVIREKTKQYGKLKQESFIAKHVLNLQEANKKLKELFKKIEKSQLIIADSLHEIIFAYITKTPCVVLPTISKTASSIFDWIKEAKFIQFCNNFDEIDSFIKIAISAPKEHLPLAFNYQILESVLKNEKLPKISILIPVYNTEKYLPRCLDSLSSQLYRNIEIICVDDGSSDSSLQILQNRGGSSFQNFKIYKNKTNVGLLITRKEAISYANGDYVMFLDSDDTIEEFSCNILANAILKFKTDIIGFDFNLINLCQKENESEFVTNYFKTSLSNFEILSGDDIFDNCVYKKKMPYNIWNKIYKIDICRAASENIISAKITYGEDYFVTNLFDNVAKSFIYIDKKLYNYYFGIGGSSIVKNELETINNSFKELETHIYLRDVLSKINAPVIYHKANESKIKLIAQYIISHSLALPVSDFVRDVFKRLFKLIGSLTLVESLMLTNLNDQGKIAEIVYKSDNLKVSKKEIKNIGIFYYKLCDGGVERVVSLLSDKLFKRGYNVTIFINKGCESKQSFAINDNIKIISIPSSYEMSSESHDYVRPKALRDELIKNKIDCLLYQASSDENMIFDLIIAKSLGIYFITTSHELFGQELSFLSPYFSKRIPVLFNADMVQVLNDFDLNFYKSFGLNTIKIQNPISFDVNRCNVSNFSTKNILWINRVDYLQKRPLEAIEIFSLVVNQIPDAKLFLIGKEWQKGYVKVLNEHIKNLRLENSIKIVGYTTDLDHYYKDAALFIMTSAFETFSMVLCESMSYGLPCVMYELPYLELVKNNKGLISIPDGDRISFANAIIKILKDKEYQAKLGAESRKKIIEFAKDDPIDVWVNIFKKIDGSNIENNDIKKYYFCKPIFDFYSYGLSNSQNNQNKPMAAPSQPIQNSQISPRKPKLTALFPLGSFRRRLLKNILLRRETRARRIASKVYHAIFK